MILAMRRQPTRRSMTSMSCFLLRMRDWCAWIQKPGDVHWEVAHRIRPRDRYNAVSPIVFDDMVCVVTGPSVKPGIRCFKLKPDMSYTEPWADFKLLNTQYSNLVLVEKFLFGFTPTKQGGPELRCINIEKGKVRWIEQPQLGVGNMLAVGEHLLVLGERGNLSCFELSAEKPVEVCRTSEPILAAPCYTSMALANGLLFARNEQKLLCLDLREQATKK